MIGFGVCFRGNADQAWSKHLGEQWYSKIAGLKEYISNRVLFSVLYHETSGPRGSVPVAKESK